MTSQKLSLSQIVGEDLFHKAGLDRLGPNQQFLLARFIEARVEQAVRFAEEQERRQPSEPQEPPEQE